MKNLKIIHSIIILIGVCGFSVGLANSVGAISEVFRIKEFYGQPQMSFNTAVIVMLFGAAFYLTGKSLMLNVQKPV